MGGAGAIPASRSIKFMNEITKLDNVKDDYLKCLEDGKAFQEAFKDMLIGMGVIAIDNDKNDRRDLDLLIMHDDGRSVGLDVKKVGVPFRKSQSFVGIAPAKAIPLNENKLNFYYKSKNRDGHMVFVVDYRPEIQIHGIFLISVEEAYRIYKEYPNRTREYNQRTTINKTNAKSVTYISTDECTKLPDHYFDSLVKAWKKNNG